MPNPVHRSFITRLEVGWTQFSGCGKEFGWSSLGRQAAAALPTGGSTPEYTWATRSSNNMHCLGWWGGDGLLNFIKDPSHIQWLKLRWMWSGDIALMRRVVIQDFLLGVGTVGWNLGTGYALSPFLNLSLSLTFFYTEEWVDCRTYSS